LISIHPVKPALLPKAVDAKDLQTCRH